MSNSLEWDRFFHLMEDRRLDNVRKMNRVKKLYHDDESFNQLMLKIVEKDNKNLQKMVNGEDCPPTSWNTLEIIMDIAQEEGLGHIKLDPITESYGSRSMKYRGWTFIITHDEGTIYSIFDPNENLIYRF